MFLRLLRSSTSAGISRRAQSSLRSKEYRRFFASEATGTSEETSSEDDGAADEPYVDEAVELFKTRYKFTPPPPISEESKKHIQGIFDRLVYLDIVELSILSNIVADRAGDGAATLPDLFAGGGGGAAASSEDAEPEVKEEAKTIFDIKLVGYDAKAKIKVIKEVRSIAGLGLKEAKELVEGAPKVVQKDLKAERAEELKAQLEAIGAQIEIV